MMMLIRIDFGECYGIMMIFVCYLMLIAIWVMYIDHNIMLMLPKSLRLCEFPSKHYYQYYSEFTLIKVKIFWWYCNGILLRIWLISCYI